MSLESWGEVCCSDVGWGVEDRVWGIEIKGYDREYLGL